VSEWATKIPGAFFYVPAPSWPVILVYYAVIIVVLSGWLKTARRKIVAAAILIFIAGVYCWRWEQARAETELTVLPLNGGHAVFVDAAGRRNDWLVDCGDEKAVNFTLKNFLRAEGVNQIPRLVLTHGDMRNIGGAELLAGLFDVGELVTGPVRFRSAAYRDAVGAFDKPPSRHKIFQRGDTAGCWRVLHPDAANDFPRADDNALVLLGTFDGTRILLLSDLGRAGQDALLSRPDDLHADIVVAGLPGAGEPLCEALIDAVRPKVIVIADSEFPATRRASRELKDRLAQGKIPVIYTRDSGAVKITLSQTGWRLQAMDGPQLVSR
jgi:competence protein ComEC